MGSTKVTTVIANRTGDALVLKVGNRNCFANLGTIQPGGEHKLELDVNWTYQEFSLELVKKGVMEKMVVSSDDCCDFELITVTESGGNYQVDKVARGQGNASHVDAPFAGTNWSTRFTWFKFNWRFWRKIERPLNGLLR